MGKSLRGNKEYLLKVHFKKDYAICSMAAQWMSRGSMMQSRFAKFSQEFVMIVQLYMLNSKTLIVKSVQNSADNCAEE